MKKALLSIINDRLGTEFPRILVVGCGKGQEAVQLAENFTARFVVGIDKTTLPKLSPCPKNLKLAYADATSLQFPDNYFDLVFCHHVLEHIPDYRRALTEIKRVMHGHGSFVVAAPNRDRIVGYLGSENSGAKKKMLWNMNDWKMKLQGRFRNEYGAHAGFTKQELKSEMDVLFPSVEDITLQYYRLAYQRLSGLLNLMHRTGFSRFLFPSMYFICR